MTRKDHVMSEEEIDQLRKLDRTGRAFKHLRMVGAEEENNRPPLAVPVAISAPPPAPTPFNVEDAALADSVQKELNEQQSNYLFCEKWRMEYSIQPGHDWGNLEDQRKQKEWQNRKCDELIYDHESKLHQLQLIKSKSILHSTHTKPSRLTSFPLIAICIATTTRHVYNLSSLSDLSLFSSLLPSILATVEPNYEYFIYITYDLGDLFYDEEGREKEIQEWFEEEIKQEAKEAIDVEMRLFLLSFENKQNKPGPVFNHITKIAYEDGADYIYRINDDTIMESGGWTTALIEQLKKQAKEAAAIESTSPSSSSSSSSLIYGVVGPSCDVGPSTILTHDFVSRQHLEIFSTYYPISLSDWWMDDWISRVYGAARTTKVKEVKVGHSGDHGTRYGIEKRHQDLLPKEIGEGRKMISYYMKKKGATRETIERFQSEPLTFQLR